MSDLNKKLSFEAHNYQFTNLDVLAATHTSALQTLALLKTVMNNQVRIISKLESLNEDVVFEETSKQFSKNLEDVVADWTSKGWLTVIEQKG